MLLLEEAERDIQRLGEDPPLNPLIVPLRITPTDASNHEEELYGSKIIPQRISLIKRTPTSCHHMQDRR
jgi:hypothetical protein